MYFIRYGVDEGIAQLAKTAVECKLYPAESGQDGAIWTLVIKKVRAQMMKFRSNGFQSTCLCVISTIALFGGLKRFKMLSHHDRMELWLDLCQYALLVTTMAMFGGADKYVGLEEIRSKSQAFEDHQVRLTCRILRSCKGAVHGGYFQTYHSQV